MDNEIQRNMLFVQLKILKELRQLNRTLTEGIHHPDTVIYKKEIFMKDLEDVREAVSICGYKFI
jgi:hypothetical protein